MECWHDAVTLIADGYCLLYLLTICYYQLSAGNLNFSVLPVIGKQPCWNIVIAVVLSSHHENEFERLTLDDTKAAGV